MSDLGHLFITSDTQHRAKRLDGFEARENALHDAMKAAIETGEPQWIGNYIHFEKGSVRCYVVAKVDD